MPEPVQRRIKVLKADYIKDADSILIIGECAEGRFRNQIHSSCFSFGDRDKEIEMKKTAKMMVGKTINLVFDTYLENKIEDNYKLEY